MGQCVLYASEGVGPMTPGMAELAPHNARNAGTTRTPQLMFVARSTKF